MHQREQESSAGRVRLHQCADVDIALRDHAIERRDHALVDLLDRTTLGRNIRPLERDGLIAVEPDPSDGRSKSLQMTRTGDARFRRAQKHWAEAQRRFEHAYGGRQASQLRENLRALVASDLGPFDNMAAE